MGRFLARTTGFRLCASSILANIMTDWKARAAAANPPVPEEILERVVPPLEALEAAFHPLKQRIPPDELAWNGPYDG